jgi:5-oxoprolinase (ATP-hydrolysing)
LVAALQSGPWPAREPRQNVADLTAQLAAIQSGTEQLQQLVAAFGVETVVAYMGHIRTAAARAVSRLCRQLDDGEAACRMDDGCVIRVSITVDKLNGRATIDFTGTSPQQPTNINAPSSVCHAAVLYVFRTLTGEAIPLNSGCLEPLTIKIPAGSMLAPTEPAAVVAGNVETSQIICDALMLATGSMAGSQGTMNNLTFGNGDAQYYETLCGGGGATATGHGASAVHTHMTNSRLTDPEVLESRYPVVLEHFGIRRDTGGNGLHRGGDGVIRTIRFNETMDVSLLAGRRSTRPPGISGGSDGQPGAGFITRNRVRESIDHRAQLRLNAGDSITIETPGGGGYGPPVIVGL